MHRFAALPLLAMAMGLSACAGATGAPVVATYQPAAGISEVLRGEIAAAPGHSLVVGDIVGDAGFAIPRHYHHGEEFLYVLGGSAIISREGMADMTLRPDDSLRIAPGTLHWGRAGSEGLRAVTSWVVPDGQPLRVPAPTAGIEAAD